MATPEELKYTEQHEWVAMAGEGGAGTVRLGITDYAQQQLGDVVYVQLPQVGEQVGDPTVPIGEVESTKSVSDIYSPVRGEVTKVNTALEESPELINSDPYGEGWMVEISLADQEIVEGLLDAAGYRALTEQD